MEEPPHRLDDSLHRLTEPLGNRYWIQDPRDVLQSLQGANATGELEHQPVLRILRI